MEQGTVFDIGLHNGDDSAYYLSLGYSVIGVDANPLLTESCEKRFSEYIAAGRMTILNVGILDRPGSFSFYRNLTDSGWSSFVAERGKHGGKWEEIKVTCCTTRELIDRFGRPAFMKIDIEGVDVQALNSLTPDLCPEYVSLELSLDDKIIEILAGLGYQRFKLVHGGSYYASSPIFPDEIGWRILRKTSRKISPAKKLIDALPASFRPKLDFDPPGCYSPDGYPFSRYSSGPFGEKAAGKWLSADQALTWIENIRSKCRKFDEPFWFDVHAHVGKRKHATLS